MRASILLFALSFLLVHATSAQTAALPVSPDHWSHELLSDLDAAGLANGWMADFRPASRTMIRAELTRVVRGSFGGGELADEWLDRFDDRLSVGGGGEQPRSDPRPRAPRRWELGFRTGLRDGRGLLDPGSGLVGTASGAVRVGPAAFWARAGESGRRFLDEPLRSGGVAFPLGPFDVALGRFRVKAAGPSSSSAQLAGEVPLDALYAVTRSRSTVPGLGWLFGPVAWHFALAPWTEAGEWDEGWIGLGGAIAEPSPHFRIGLVRTARFGGDRVSGFTPARFVRTVLNLQNRPTTWDDQKLELTFRGRGRVLGQPFAIHAVVGQEDSPPWRDPAVLAGVTLPFLRRAGLWVFRYEYEAVGARARFCPVCTFNVFTPGGAFASANWYRHEAHPPYERNGIPVGASLGGYGASHTARLRFWDGPGRYRVEAWTFFQVREEGNLLLDRWPGKRRGGGVGGLWFPAPGFEVVARALVADGPGMDREWGGVLTASWTHGGGEAPVSQLVRPPAPPHQLSSLRPGDRIEVWSPLLVDRRATGRFDALQEGTLRWRSAEPDTTYGVPLEAVERLRVKTGTHPATLRGAFFGAAAGLIAAVAYDEATGERIDRGFSVDVRWGLRAGIWAGVTGLGALIGSRVQVDEWRDLRDLERP